MDNVPPGNIKTVQWKNFYYNINETTRRKTDSINLDQRKQEITLSRKSAYKIQVLQCNSAHQFEEEMWVQFQIAPNKLFYTNSGYIFVEDVENYQSWMWYVFPLILTLWWKLKLSYWLIMNEINCLWLPVNDNEKNVKTNPGNQSKLRKNLVMF